MEPIPLGTLVEYNDRPGERYVITAHADPETMFSDEEMVFVLLDERSLDEMYPDRVAYEIWKEGVLRRFGNRMYMYHRVRRSSLTVIEKENDADPAHQD